METRQHLEARRASRGRCQAPTRAPITKDATTVRVLCPTCLEFWDWRPGDNWCACHTPSWDMVFVGVDTYEAAMRLGGKEALRQLLLANGSAAARKLKP